MKTHLRQRFPSIALAGLVLVIAMAASATAAGMITGKNIKNGTITGIDVKNGSLTGADLRNGAVTGVDVRNGSLTGVDVRDGSLTGVDVRNGSLGLADLTEAARASFEFIGSPCLVPPADTAGTVKMVVDQDGTIALLCETPPPPPPPPPVDADEDGFTTADGDCDDSDSTVHPGAEEIADGKDNDCDGDLGTGFPAYSGPGGTAGVGICHAGTADEIADPPFLGPITGEQTPVAEIPDNTLDDDCDGETDET